MLFIPSGCPQCRGDAEGWGRVRQDLNGFGQVLSAAQNVDACRRPAFRAPQQAISPAQQPAIAAQGGAPGDVRREDASAFSPEPARKRQRTALASPPQQQRRVLSPNHIALGRAILSPVRGRSPMKNLRKFQGDNEGDSSLRTKPLGSNTTRTLSSNFKAYCGGGGGVYMGDVAEGKL